MVCTPRSKHSAKKHSTKKYSAKLLAIAIVSSSVLAGCGSRLQTAEMSAPSGGAAPQMTEATAADAVQNTAAQTAATVPAPQPQLVRTANLDVRVESIETAIEQAQAIIRQQQGEVMNLQDQTPSPGSPHRATIRIRVPQTKLDAAIASLLELGTVQQQSLSAEDVSTQLVDYQARLRNLRRSEETVLKIMDRSGSVGDVLKVAQELNTIRQNIEQINAQLSSLQNQVAYSTIDLQLASAIAPVPDRPSTQTQLANTWNSATQSIGKFTLDLMQLGLWLLVYSPYLLLMLSAAALLYRRRRRVRSVRE
ncbi:MAG: DUF4349 domain-containing protein [Leptolyngbyaceae cyanobacterium SM1_3_5]|nr:DUF4349 domain-containing protein [Leptolyngbyaceae cyanobacterium SM1_3_5]